MRDIGLELTEFDVHLKINYEIKNDIKLYTSVIELYETTYDNLFQEQKSHEEALTMENPLVDQLSQHIS